MIDKYDILQHIGMYFDILYVNHVQRPSCFGHPFCIIKMRNKQIY